MGFLGFYRALYDYAAQAPNELEVREGDLLYVLEKSSEDDWWRAKRKGNAGEDHEAEGLVPNNYIEEVGRNVTTEKKLAVTNIWLFTTRFRA